jgi:hypothetical protein
MALDVSEVVPANQRGEAPQEHGGAGSLPTVRGYDTWRHKLIDSSMWRSIWAPIVDKEVIKHMVRSNEGGERESLAGIMATLKHHDLVVVFITLWGNLACKKKCDT